MWCMIPLNVTGVLGEWFAGLPKNLPGNRQDGFNTLLTVVPSQSVLDEVDVVVLDETSVFNVDEEGQQLDTLDKHAMTMRSVVTIGRTLLSAGNVVIVGSKQSFIEAYNTPHWKLWCAPEIYASDDDEEYQAQLALLGIPSAVTRHQAREIIKTQVE